MLFSDFLRTEIGGASLDVRLIPTQTRMASDAGAVAGVTLAILALAALSLYGPAVRNRPRPILIAHTALPNYTIHNAQASQGGGDILLTLLPQDTLVANNMGRSCVRLVWFLAFSSRLLCMCV